MCSIVMLVYQRVSSFIECEFSPVWWVLTQLWMHPESRSRSTGEVSRLPSVAMDSDSPWKNAHQNTMAGWWFGTCFILQYIGNNTPI